MFKPLERASPTLQTMVRNITLDGATSGKAPTVVQVLEGMVDTPPHWLSEEAAQMLDTLAPAERGGGPRKPRDALLSPAQHTPGDPRGSSFSLPMVASTKSWITVTSCCCKPTKAATYKRA